MRKRMLAIATIGTFLTLLGFSCGLGTSGVDHIRIRDSVTPPCTSHHVPPEDACERRLSWTTQPHRESIGYSYFIHRFRWIRSGCTGGNGADRA